MLQELAVQLLTKQLEDPAWNQSFVPYFESLPRWGTLYSKEIWHLDPDHIALFQEPYLASARRTHLFPAHAVEAGLYHLITPDTCNCLCEQSYPVRLSGKSDF